METRRVRHMLFFGGLFALSALALSAFGTASTNTAPDNRHKSAAQPSSTRSVMAKPIRFTTLLQQESTGANPTAAWSPLIPAMATPTGKIAWNQRIVELSTTPRQIPYVILGHYVYWVDGQQIYASTLSPVNGKIIYASGKITGRPAPELQLWSDGRSAFFSQWDQTSSIWQLFAVSGAQVSAPLITLKNGDPPSLHALAWGNSTYIAVTPANLAGNTQVIAIQDTAAKQVVDLPVWPIKLAIHNQSLYLLSGPFSYLIEENGEMVRSSAWSNPSLLQAFAPLASGFQSASLYLPVQFQHPTPASAELFNPRSYELAIGPEADGSTIQAMVTVQSKNLGAALYDSWMGSLRTLDAGASGRSFLTNADVQPPTKLPGFWGNLPIRHQFILFTPYGEWVRWSQTKTGANSWYASWGTRGWMYTLGPLASPAAPSSMALLQQQIELAKLNNFASYSAYGTINLKVEWQQEFPVITKSEYTFEPAAQLQVTVSTNGYSGWDDLAKFQVLDNPRAKTGA